MSGPACARCVPLLTSWSCEDSSCPNRPQASEQAPAPAETGPAAAITAPRWVWLPAIRGWELRDGERVIGTLSDDRRGHWIARAGSRDAGRWPQGGIWGLSGPQAAVERALGLRT